MTAARTLARRAVAAVRTADRHIGRALGRAIVLVEARTPMNLAVLQPVYAPLLQDPRLDVPTFSARSRPPASPTASFLARPPGGCASTCT
jgi:hypothetical protein